MQQMAEENELEVVSKDWTDQNLKDQKWHPIERNENHELKIKVQQDHEWKLVES